jgi:hypothetical protein
MHSVDVTDARRLAPRIQEEILFLPAVTEGDDPVRERLLLPIVAMLDWGKQRKVRRDNLSNATWSSP